MASLFDRFFRRSKPHSPNVTAVNDETTARQFVADLANLDYFAFVENQQDVKAQLVRSLQAGSLSTEPDCENGSYTDRRLYHVDAENLSDGLSDAIDLLAPVLERQSLHLDSVVDIHSDDGLSLRINDNEYLVYDWPNQEPADLDTWGLSHKRLVEIVNNLLESTTSNSRLYGIGGFNDAHVILLTREMFEHIRSASVTIARDWLPRTSSEMVTTHGD